MPLRSHLVTMAVLSLSHDGVHYKSDHETDQRADAENAALGVARCIVLGPGLGADDGSETEEDEVGSGYDTLLGVALDVAGQNTGRSAEERGREVERCPTRRPWLGVS